MIAEAPGRFGTKVRIVAFVEEGRNPVSKNLRMEATVSAPTTDQADLVPVTC